MQLSLKQTRNNLPVVEFVGHTALDRGVGLDIDDITDLVGLQIRRQMGGSLFTEVTREEMAGTRSVTKRMRHFYILISLEEIGGFEKPLTD